jgi:hypothetical protein
MLSNAIALLERHRTSGAYFDTNLMLVMAVGNYDPNRIETFKRTMAYTPKEYALLLKICNRCGRRLTTPNILTEVDNLSRQLPEREHKMIAAHMQRLVADMFETYHESIELLGSKTHEQMGLTDTVLIALAERHLIITADFPLANRIETLGRDVINFNHLRVYA